MKRIIILAGLLIALSSTTWAQSATQNNTRNREQDKTQMQKDDTNKNKKGKKDATKKMNKSKKASDEEALKMDQYDSNKQTNSGNREEQRHMDSTINNHR